MEASRVSKYFSLSTTDQRSDSDSSSTSPDHDILETDKYFFNPKVSISSLKHLKELDNVDELFNRWNQTQKKIIEWASSSTSPVKSSTILTSPNKISYPNLLTPPPGFESFTPKSPLLSTCSSQKDPNSSLRKIIPLSTNAVKLKPAPTKIGWIKREKRGTFIVEEVYGDRQSGVLKFYQLRKRFGFITLDIDKSDIFLCEDDLVISKIDMKRFKAAVHNKEQVRMDFLVKTYMENGAEKRKAIDIELLDEHKD